MATRYTADEVLEMAARIETKGATFYRKAAKLNVAARDLLLEIADQEDQHYAAFAEMRKALAPAEKAPAADPSGEVELYLQAMVDGQAFDINQDPADLLTGKESAADLFGMAIALEKDSIVFYLGLKHMVPRAMGRDRIDRIVKEELKHIAWLSGKRQGLRG